MKPSVSWRQFIALRFTILIHSATKLAQYRCFTHTKSSVSAYAVFIYRLEAPHFGCGKLTLYGREAGGDHGNTHTHTHTQSFHSVTCLNTFVTISDVMTTLYRKQRRLPQRCTSISCGVESAVKASSWVVPTQDFMPFHQEWTGVESGKGNR